MVAIKNCQSCSSMIVVAFSAAIIWWLVTYPLRSLVISRPMSLLRTHRQAAAICLPKTTSSRLHVRQKAPISTIPTINLHVHACRHCLVNSSIHEGSHPWKAATIIQSWTYVLHFKRGLVWCLGAQWWQRKSAHLPHYSALDSIASSRDCCAKRPTWAQHHVRAASPTSICKSQLFATISRMVSIK